MKITNENLVATFRASGLTQESFCKKHNISIERLRYYLYKKNPGKQNLVNSIQKSQLYQHSLALIKNNPLQQK